MRNAWMMTSLVLAVSAWGCSDSTIAGAGDSTVDASAGGGGAPGGGGGSGSDSPFETTASGRVECKDGKACACDNGRDDDGDGKVDDFDPECTGPYDDDEGSFATGIPGDNVDFCQDCFFDGNSGHGDDGCQYHTACIDPDQAEPSGPMSNSGCFNCETSQQCEDFCKPRTPNGCDCFGCCTVARDNGDTVNVDLGSGADCSLDNLDACDSCTKSDSCNNECGRCELCLGKTEDDLPDSCFDGGDSPDAGTGGHTCEDGSQACDQSNPCPTDEFCQTGCCQPTVL